MISLILVALAAGAMGFGLGRVKNSSKLAALKAEIAKIEAFGSKEEQALVAKAKELLSKVGL